MIFIIDKLLLKWRIFFTVLVEVSQHSLTDCIWNSLPKWYVVCLVKASCKLIRTPAHLWLVTWNLWLRGESRKLAPCLLSHIAISRLVSVFRLSRSIWNQLELGDIYWICIWQSAQWNIVMDDNINHLIQLLEESLFDCIKKAVPCQKSWLIQACWENHHQLSTVITASSHCYSVHQPPAEKNMAPTEQGIGKSTFTILPCEGPEYFFHTFFS